MKRAKIKRPVKSHKDKNKTGWLIFFYSVPSKPVSNRVKIWRRLSKTGAVQLKDSVYILPHNDMHYEFFQWLVSEVIGMNGDAAFLKSESVETLKDTEINELFDQQRGKDYGTIEKELEVLENITNSFKKGSRTHGEKKISERFSKLSRDFEEIRKIDFFCSDDGKLLMKRVQSLEREIHRLSGTVAEKEVVIEPRNPEDYQGKIWATRKRPFIDRMGSAWLIKEFIDRKPAFQFIDEEKVDSLDKNMIAFDVRGGEFTHVGNMCTFEVILKSFRIKDRTLNKIAEIVHELDLNDDTFSNPEAKGIEEILIGIRKTEKDDRKILEKGMAVFSMLYASKS
jgi:hypothetical protein